MAQWILKELTCDCHNVFTITNPIITAELEFVDYFYGVTMKELKEDLEERLKKPVRTSKYDLITSTPWSPIIIKPKVDRVIFHNPATIIYWKDGSKTVVKCQPGDTYDEEKGFMAAYLKKLLGNDNTFNKEIKKYVKED